mmetsp:Transcript_9901/g.16225  ORF Transcript_9901/g.16225 Transcript_9901/m.16225 type:complete len:121 (+) Transcript_9901:123-485(+)
MVLGLMAARGRVLGQGRLMMRSGVLGKAQRREFGAAQKIRADGQLNVPHVKKIHKIGGEGMQIVMWLWIFYRAKEDGLAVLGLQHPWDAHGDHGHDDHHDSLWKDLVFERQIGEMPSLAE